MISKGVNSTKNVVWVFNVAHMALKLSVSQNIQRVVSSLVLECYNIIEKYTY